VIAFIQSWRLTLVLLAGKTPSRVVCDGDSGFPVVTLLMVEGRHHMGHTVLIDCPLYGHIAVIPTGWSQHSQPSPYPLPSLPSLPPAHKKKAAWHMQQQVGGGNAFLPSSYLLLSEMSNHWMMFRVLLPDSICFYYFTR